MWFIQLIYLENPINMYRFQSNDTYTVSSSRDVGPSLWKGETEVKRVTKTAIKRLYMTVVNECKCNWKLRNVNMFSNRIFQCYIFQHKKKRKIYHSFFKLADIHIFIQMKQTISFFSLQSTRLWTLYIPHPI